MLHETNRKLFKSGNEGVPISMGARKEPIASPRSAGGNTSDTTACATMIVDLNKCIHQKAKRGLFFNILDGHQIYPTMKPCKLRNTKKVVMFGEKMQPTVMPSYIISESERMGRRPNL